MNDVTLSPSHKRVFLEELKEFVLSDARISRQQLADVLHRPLVERVQKGYAITDVHITPVSSQLVIARCQENHSRFRDGDVVRLHRGDVFGYEAECVRQCTIWEEDGNELHIIASSPLFREQRTGWIIDMDEIDTSEQVVRALDMVADGSRGRQRILPLLMGMGRSIIHAGRQDRGWAMGEAIGLNDSQTEAFADAYATEWAHLVQGPPGTGKTFVLANLALALAHDGQRVLVTGLTHRSINNALNKVAACQEHFPDDDIATVKIGQLNQARDLDEEVDRERKFSEWAGRDTRAGYIVGATPFAARSTKRLSMAEFDTVIFDEASQITLPLAVMGMLSAEKYIFFGDHQQLPPVTVDEQTPARIRASVFETLVDRGMDTLLTQTYRLNAELTAWPNRHFYDGELETVFPHQRIQYPKPPVDYLDLLDPDDPLLFWDIGLANTKSFSNREANAVAELVEAIYKTGLSLEEVGVVVPYRAQARLIRTRLYGRLPREIVRQLVVDTVERMQGQERDFIILSLTTTDATYARQLFDFFFQPNRLNVAVTRARCKLVIIGSPYVLHVNDLSDAQQAIVDLLADLMNSCGRIVYEYG